MQRTEPPMKRQSGVLWQITLVFSLGLLIAITGFGAGILAQRDLLNDGGASDRSNPNTEFSRLNEVKSLIDSEYYGDPADPTAAAEFQKSLEYGAIQGMMGVLDDYSTFLVPEQQTAVQEQMSGEYQGIGVWVDFPEGKLRIVSPIPGSPAEAAGLKAGDVIEAADGHSLANTTPEDALNFVRGPEGTKVRLTIRREGVAEPFDVDVERRRIPMQSVVYQYLVDEEIAYIQVKVFGDKTTAELDASLKQAQDDEVKGIIIDLRNNGGGWVQSAQEMIGRFVSADRGPALYEDLNPDGSERTPQPILQGEATYFDIPLVVLVNHGTASASEIVAGALRDYGRATIVGETTFGKGSVQRVHDFADGSSARITFAEWLTPQQHRIQGVGIEPDVPAELIQTADGQDSQLQAAIAVLTGVPYVPPAAASPVASPVATPIPSPVS